MFWNTDTQHFSSLFLDIIKKNVDEYVTSEGCVCSAGVLGVRRVTSTLLSYENDQTGF